MPHPIAPNTPHRPSTGGRCFSAAAAFTLVELLVVVAIIALLIAILLPSLGRVRELATRAVCASNQRQIALASLDYTNDFRGHLPLTTRDNGFEHASWVHSTVYQVLRAGDVPDKAMVCPNREDLFGLAVQRLIDDLPDSHPKKDLWQQVVDTQGEDVGVRVGYYILFGRSGTPWEPDANPWVSRQRITDRDADQGPDVAPLMTDVIERGTHTYGGRLTAPHGPTGFVGPGADPEAIGSVGGNVATVDGAVNWRSQADMLPHAATASGAFPTGQSGYW